MNILFVCSRNKRRSLTAESIYKNNSEFNVRSAGTEPSARVKLTAKLIDWSDVIFVMEKNHKQRITENFRELSNEKNIVILDIPDEYEYMDEELIEMIKISVDNYLNE